MVDELVPTERTHMTAADVYVALRHAWIAILGTAPTRGALLTLLSQWSLETGGGGASNNWNLGGVKWTAGCGRDYAEYETQEVFPRTYAMTLVMAGKAKIAHDNGATITVLLPQRFRAFDSLQESAFDYLRTLRTDFGFAWPAVEAGDVADFAHRLKIRRYYTAPEETYAAGLAGRYEQLDKTIPETPDEIPTTPDTPTALADGRPAYVMANPESDPPPDAA